MKYMSFNSSCSYTGLANLLALQGIDTEDHQIALDMALPYLFAYEDGEYRSGPMLQGKRWFDLYLRPRGFELMEAVVARDSLPDTLTHSAPAMLGLLVNERSKHAVIFTQTSDECFCFLNNRHPKSDEPDTLRLTREELLRRVDEQVHVATLARVPQQPVSLRPLLEQSLNALDVYRADLLNMRHEQCNRTRLLSLMNSHFRASLLDALTMMQLIHEESLVAQLTQLQHALLTAVKSNAEGPLEQLLPMDKLTNALVEYSALITRKMSSL